MSTLEKRFKDLIHSIDAMIAWSSFSYYPTVDRDLFHLRVDELAAEIRELENKENKNVAPRT